MDNENETQPTPAQAPAPKRGRPPQPKAEDLKPTPAPVENIAFLQRAWANGWQFVDSTYKVEVIDYHPDPTVLALGFKDINDRKEIILSASKTVWAKIFKDGLAFIESTSKKAT